jgi:hypothetical protein
VVLTTISRSGWREQLGQARDDHVARQVHRQIHAYSPAQAAAGLEHAGHLLGVDEQAASAREQLLSVGREADHAGRALEQAAAQLGLELLHAQRGAPRIWS